MEETKYLPLTEDLTVYVPDNDMRYRTLLPPDFDDQLIMEDPMIPFVYTRNFLVMTNQGLRHKHLAGECARPQVTATRRIEDTRMAKIVDMISCTAIQDRNETCCMVRVRWQSVDWTGDTWVLSTRIQNTALLQQFYMGASSSWQTSHLITKMARYKYSSEEKLWDEEPGISKWKREHGIVGYTKPASRASTQPTHPHSTSSSTSVARRSASPRRGAAAASYSQDRPMPPPPPQYSFHYARYGGPKKQSPTAAELRMQASKQYSVAVLSSKHTFAADTAHPTTTSTSNTSSSRTLRDNSHSHRRVEYRSRSTSPSRHRTDRHNSHHPRDNSHHSRDNSHHPRDNSHHPRDNSQRNTTGSWGTSTPGSHHHHPPPRQSGPARTVVKVSQPSDHGEARPRQSSSSSTRKEDDQPTSKRARTSPEVPQQRGRIVGQDRLAVLADRRLKRQHDTAPPPGSAKGGTSEWQIPKRVAPSTTTSTTSTPQTSVEAEVKEDDDTVPPSPTGSRGSHAYSPPSSPCPVHRSSSSMPKLPPPPHTKAASTTTSTTPPDTIDPLKPVDPRTKAGSTTTSTTPTLSIDQPIDPRTQPQSKTASTTSSSQTTLAVQGTTSTDPLKPKDPRTREPSTASSPASTTTSTPATSEVPSDNPSALLGGSSSCDTRTNTAAPSLIADRPIHSPKTKPMIGDLGSKSTQSNASTGWGDLAGSKPSGGWGNPSTRSTSNDYDSTSRGYGSSTQPSDPRTTPTSTSTRSTSSSSSSTMNGNSTRGWGGEPRPRSGWGGDDLPLSGTSRPSGGGGGGGPSRHPSTDSRRTWGGADSTRQRSLDKRPRGSRSRSKTRCRSRSSRSRSRGRPREPPNPPEQKAPEQPVVPSTPPLDTTSCPLVAVKPAAPAMWTPYTTPRTSAIQCVCGADAVDDYTGEWVQCWGDACCGYWFHTTCVDMPSSLRPIFQCPSCCTSPTSSPLHPPQSIKRLFDCCQTNSWRLFHSLSSSSTAVDLTSFLAYQPSLLGGCNGLVVAAQVSALAILQDMLRMFSPNQVQSSVNLLNQTPLHVAILNGHLHCVPVLTQMQPRWHHVADVYSALPLDYLLQVRPAEVLPLLQDKPDLVHVTNPSTGNSIAHAICAIVPPDFASLLAVIPVSQLCSVNHHGQTPAMTLIQSPHVLRHHFELLVQQMASSPDWWTCVDDQGRSVLHFALMYKHPWALEVADLSRFRHFQLLHLAAECALPSAVAVLVAAKFSPQQLHGTSRSSGATLGTGWWPILHATSPGCVLELLRVDTGAQLQYLYHQSQAHSTKVLSILNSIASHLPLYDFIQATAAANPHEYLGSRCLFLQRYRKCLRLDLKLTQLKLHVASLIVVPSRAAKRVITVPSERELWKVLQSAVISTWKCPIQVEIAGELHSSKDTHMWTVLASQLRQLGPHLFASSSRVFELLGKLIGHMVLVGQQLPSAVLPPSFLSTPAEFKPDLALDFKKGLDSVLPNALDNWNGYERFLLLHRVIFPQTMSQWKATKVHYDKPFHAHHPSILAFWTVIEKHLVPQEQLVCRLRCGQPLRITPAPTVGIVEKSVLGIPEAISMDRLHVDLVLYIRGFRKHAKHT